MHYGDSDRSEILAAKGGQEVNAGDRLYFGAVTYTEALESTVYTPQGEKIGTIGAEDLALVSSFGGSYGIYCYTVPESQGRSFVMVNHDTAYQDYYQTRVIAAGTEVGDTAVVDEFINAFGVAQVSSGTKAALAGKSALFVGDSITYGARDTKNIYGSGGWAGRIGYYCDMDVTNNGVSGACVTTARLNSYSAGHYIYNNLTKVQGNSYDYVIMHGLFNDASEKVTIGSAVSAVSLTDPTALDVSLFAPALCKMFYAAKTLYPDAKLGYIINFKTDRNVDLEPYVEAAKSACAAWEIPYLDLYNMEGFTVEFADGLHPTSAGYDSMYDVVADWMVGLE